MNDFRVECQQEIEKRERERERDTRDVCMQVLEGEWKRTAGEEKD